MAAGWDIASEEPAKANDPWAVVGTEQPRTSRKLTLAEQATAAANSVPAQNRQRQTDMEKNGNHQFFNDVASVGNDFLVKPVLKGIVGVGSHLVGDDAATHDESQRFIDQQIPSTAGAQEFEHNLADNPVGHTVGKAAHAVKSGLDTVIGKPASDEVVRATSDVAGVLPVLGPELNAMRTAGAVTEIPKSALPTPAATTPDEMLRAAGYRTRPSDVSNMTGAGTQPSPLAQAGQALGDSGAQQADHIKYNRTVTNNHGAVDIGLPSGTVLTPENIVKAKEAPGATYDKVRAALPDKTPLSPEAVAEMQQAGVSDLVPGQELHPAIGKSRESLANTPMNADDLMKAVSRLREQGYKRTTPAVPGGTVDPDIESFGHGQLDLANALENELNRRVATESPQLAGEYQGARKKFAKIGTVERALNGYDIDPSKVAKAAAKTDAITGGLKIIADAHTHAPEVVRLKVPEKAGMGSAGTAVGGLLGAGVAAGMNHPVAATALAAVPAVQMAVRKLMNSTRGEARVPDVSPEGALGNYFGRDDSGFGSNDLNLTPSPGRAFEPHQPSVLRTGENLPVAEQNASPDPLSLERPPGYAYDVPRQPQLPLGYDHYTHPAESAGAAPGVLSQATRLPRSNHALADALAGDLQLAPEGAPHAPVASSADLGSVISSNVPDNIVARGAAPHRPSAGDLALSVPEPPAKPTGTALKISEGVQFSPIPDHHVIPGSTVIQRGPNFVSVTPQADGTLRITNTFVDEASRGQGAGQKNLVDAAKYAQAKGLQLTGDKTVHASQLRAYEAAKKKGLIDFDYATPELAAQAAKIVAEKGSSKVLNGKGSPVTTNIRIPSSLGDKLAE